MLKNKKYNEILKLQKELDDYLGANKRNRTVWDICQSVLAEITEFIEEMPSEYNHKTWKPKDFDIKSMKTEFVDILFFMVQLMNKLDIKKDMFEVIEDFQDRRYVMDNCRKLISDLQTSVISISREGLPTMEKIIEMFSCYSKVSSALGMSIHDIYKIYKDKLNFNFNRTDFKKHITE